MKKAAVYRLSNPVIILDFCRSIPDVVRRGLLNSSLRILL